MNETVTHVIKLILLADAYVVDVFSTLFPLLGRVLLFFIHFRSPWLCVMHIQDIDGE